MKLSNPPANENILFEKAKEISGFTLQNVALKLSIEIPKNLKRNKGWVGFLLEKYLGATSNNKSQPDFFNLGIELKTIPINKIGLPLQTTFICFVPLINNIGITWNNSYFRQKISKILWIPVEGSHDIPIHLRKIGYPFFWSPSILEDKILSKDWMELMDMVVLGNVQEINSNYGIYLQIQPKALNSKTITKSIGKNGEKIATIPLAFYFRKNLTELLIKKYLYLIE